MIKRANQLKIDTHANMRGGNGEVKVMHLLEGEEFQGKGRLFARNTLKPGCSIGMHQHQGDIEAYYILKGEPTYYDNNGEKTTLKPGDVTFTGNGESHCIENNTDEDVEFIALILFSDKKE